MKAEISVLKGRRVGECFTIQTNQKLLFGRDINCDVQLFDEGVSRRHFTVEGKGNSFLLCDLNSSNGTFVNSARTNTKILRSGDVIRAGDCHFVFHHVSADASHHGDRPQIVGDAIKPLAATISKKFDIDALGIGKVEKDTPAERYLNGLKLLYEVGNYLHAEDELGSLFNTIMDLTLQVVPADRAYLVMYQAVDDSYETVVTRRKEEATAQHELLLSRTVLNEAVKKGNSILSSDLSSDDRFKSGKSILVQDIRSVVCVPLQTQDETLGAIYLDNLGGEKGTGHIFTEFELELVSAIGRQAGIAIQRAKLFEDLENLFYGTIKALVATIEAKDRYTHGHSERVTEFAMAIAESMDLPPEDLDTIRLAAVLHDIGKIAVPERVLNKPSRLSEAEFLLIKNHPVHGAEILRNITGIDPVILGVLHHHEKWNGTGYPDGIAGEEIPLQARIIAVADAFDAMTSSRAYRRNFSVEEVVAEFERCAGDQFDAEVVDHFIALLKDGKVVPHFLRQTQTTDSNLQITGSV